MTAGTLLAMLRPVAVVVAMAWLGAAANGATGKGEPEPSLARLDDDFSSAAADLVRRCRQSGNDDLAGLIAGWELPAIAGVQQVFAIPASIIEPDCLTTPDDRSIWNDFLAARRARAEGCFAHALFAAGRHDELPTRADMAKPEADAAVGLTQRSCEAIRLIYRTLRDDPDHARAREAAGWVRRGDHWEWPAAARRHDRGQEYDPRHGWMVKGRLARLLQEEAAATDRRDEPPASTDLRRAPQFESDHWEIVSTASPSATAELASRLEATRLIWLQIFGGFTLEPADLERRIGGRGRLPPQTPHSAVLCGSREQYLAELARLEPRIDVSAGLYWQPTRTIWCYAAPALPEADTVFHEATHQLFAEARPDVVRMQAVPGRRCGFWAVEAAALYAETITKTPFGWTVGGRDRGRAAAARQQLVDESFFMPLTELTALNHEDFQSHPQLAELYDQCGGLADFFMNAHDGRYREPFVEYLVRVYTGTVQPDSLFRLCGRPAETLDEEYRERMVSGRLPGGRSRAAAAGW